MYRHHTNIQNHSYVQIGQRLDIIQPVDMEYAHILSAFNVLCKVIKFTKDSKQIFWCFNAWKDKETTKDVAVWQLYHVHMLLLHNPGDYPDPVSEVAGNSAVDTDSIVEDDMGITGYNAVRLEHGYQN